MTNRVHHIAAALLWTLLILGACQSKEAPVEKPAEIAPTPAPKAISSYIETGDLQSIAERGEIRILMPKDDSIEFLPRGGMPLDRERQQTSAFAEQLGLKPVFIPLEGHAQLIPYLLAGKGDVVAARMTVTEQRKESVAFTVPLRMVKEVVVVRPENNSITKLEDLAGKTVAVRRSSSYWETLTKLQEEIPNITLKPLSESMDTEQILYRLAVGQFDVTVSDDNIVKEVMTYRSNLKIACELPGERAVAWAVRPDAEELLESLNSYIMKKQLSNPVSAIHFGDFSKIKERKVLRVLTRNSASTYFLWRGEILGFEHELAMAFAKEHDLRVEMVVPPNREDLIPWLLEGKGDLVAASLTATEERKKITSLTFSRPYHIVSELVVARSNEKSLHDVQDLAGRTVVVRKSSSYWDTLQHLIASGIEINVEAAPENMETEEIIARVARGEYDLTVADSHIVEIEMTWREDIKSVFALGEPVSHGWVMRTANTELIEAVNQFFDRQYKSRFYNRIYKKYFKNPRRIKQRNERRPAVTGQLSPFDEIVKRNAEKYDMDWRLIVSMIYQESNFNPNARSWAGAVGLMQLLPRTAEEMGFHHLTHPESNIRAGLMYLVRMWNRFDSEISVRDRMWFSLASYNAGYGHVFDARRLAKQLGYNPNRWFNHVEKAMLLLSRPRYARRARYGYCRGQEPVQYVQEIRDRYYAYLSLETYEPQTAASENEATSAP